MMIKPNALNTMAANRRAVEQAPVGPGGAQPGGVDIGFRAPPAQPQAPTPPLGGGLRYASGQSYPGPEASPTPSPYVDRPTGGLGGVRDSARNPTGIIGNTWDSLQNPGGFLDDPTGWAAGTVLDPAGLLNPGQSPQFTPAEFTIPGDPQGQATDLVQQQLAQAQQQRDLINQYYADPRRMAEIQAQINPQRHLAERQLQKQAEQQSYGDALRLAASGNMGGTAGMRSRAALQSGVDAQQAAIAQGAMAQQAQMAQDLQRQRMQHLAGTYQPDPYTSQGVDTIHAGLGAASSGLGAQYENALQQAQNAQFYADERSRALGNLLNTGAIAITAGAYGNSSNSGGNTNNVGGG